MLWRTRPIPPSSTYTSSLQADLIWMNFGRSNKLFIYLITFAPRLTLNVMPEMFFGYCYCLVGGKGRRRVKAGTAQQCVSWLPNIFSDSMVFVCVPLLRYPVSGHPPG